jgi:hypothetical protein
LRWVTVHGRSLRASPDSRIAMSDGMSVTGSPGSAGLRSNCGNAGLAKSDSRALTATIIALAGRRSADKPMTGEHDRKNRDAIFPPSDCLPDAPCGKSTGFTIMPQSYFFGYDLW